MKDSNVTTLYPTEQLTRQQVLNMQQALMQLATEPVSTKVAYRVSKAFNQVTSVARAVEDHRVNTLKAMVARGDCVLNTEANNYDFADPARRDAFSADMAAFLAEPCGLTLFTISLAELGNTRISAMMLTQLGDLLVGEP